MEPEPDSQILVNLFVLLLCIACTAFSVLCQNTVQNAVDPELERLGQQGDRRALRVLRLGKSPLTQITYLLLASAPALCACVYAYQKFAPSLIARLQAETSLNHTVDSGVALVVVVLVLLPVYLVLGVVIPRRVGIFCAERVALRISGIYRGLCTLLFPLSWCLYHAGVQICRIFGISPNAQHKGITEEGIRTMVDQGEESGAILENEKALIEKVFAFNDTTAADIATHRTDVTAVPDTASLQELVQVSLASGYSRVPVYHEDLDDIVGIVYVKDLLKYVGNRTAERVAITDVMRKPFFVPETKSCSELFAALSERKMQIAVVIDEYGGTAGIVTMEDLLETIMGQMEDEYDKNLPEIIQTEPNCWKARGITPITTVNEITGLELPEQEHDTIGGFVVDLLGHLPQTGERPRITFENLEFTVEQMQDNRIETLLIQRLPQDTDETV